MALSQIVTAAFLGAGVPTCSPQSGETTFQPADLYYVLRSASVPSCCQPREGVAPPPATTTIATSGFGERKLAAARCHRSQRHLQPLTREHRSAFLTAPELFHRAIPAWADGVPETRFLGIGTALVEPGPQGRSTGLGEAAGAEGTEASISTRCRRENRSSKPSGT